MLTPELQAQYDAELAATKARIQAEHEQRKAELDAYRVEYRKVARKVVRALRAAGFDRFRVDNGEEVTKVLTRETDILAELGHAEVENLIIGSEGSKETNMRRHGSVSFIFGLDPAEVIADWSYSADSEEVLNEVLFSVIDSLE